MNNKPKGMGGHQSPVMEKDVWLTPPYIIEALGPFDLDPCAPAVRPWGTARKHICLPQDGLKETWEGRVFCNPPYGKHTGAWLEKCAEHGNGIALIFARTETRMFSKYVWGCKRADSVFFFEGRLHFYHQNGQRATHNSGAPSALVSYDCYNTERIANAIRKNLIYGRLIYLLKVERHQPVQGEWA